MSETKERFCEDCGEGMQVGENRKTCKNCGRKCCGHCYHHIHLFAAQVAKDKAERAAEDEE